MRKTEEQHQAPRSKERQDPPRPDSTDPWLLTPGTAHHLTHGETGELPDWVSRDYEIHRHQPRGPRQACGAGEAAQAPTSGALQQRHLRGRTGMLGSFGRPRGKMPILINGALSSAWPGSANTYKRDLPILEGGSDCKVEAAGEEGAGKRPSHLSCRHRSSVAHIRACLK